jgi:hypothetical protein
MNSETGTPAVPRLVDRAEFEAELDRLRVREKTHTREGDAIAAARRRLPAVQVDAGLELLGATGPATLLDAFEGRRQLIAYYFMWNAGRAAAEQCEGCTFYTSQVAELSYLHSRDITYAVFCQGRNVSSGLGDAAASYAECRRPADRAMAAAHGRAVGRPALNGAAAADAARQPGDLTLTRDSTARLDRGASGDRTGRMPPRTS